MNIAVFSVTLSNELQNCASVLSAVSMVLIAEACLHVCRKVPLL